MRKLCTLATSAAALVVPALALAAPPEEQPAAPRAAPQRAPRTDAAPAPMPSMTEQEKQMLIDNAMSAAPPHVAREASVVMMQEGGRWRTIHKGTNRFTCIPDNPQTPGPDPICADEQAWRWLQSYMRKEKRPRNTAPGVAYMLQGGSDSSATDPFAKPDGTFITTPPHWMILWPFDAEKTGLSTEPTRTGAWIMWAGTPYAHLMIHGNPMGEQDRVPQEGERHGMPGHQHGMPMPEGPRGMPGRPGTERAPAAPAAPRPPPEPGPARPPQR